MSVLTPPEFETRSQRQLRDELFARARLWLPELQHGAGAAGFAGALLEIAARLEAEVTQRLKRAPEKNFRGFLHWLGRKGAAARAARVPVVFRMGKGAEAIDADAPVQLQASVGDGPPIIFETDKPVRVVPSSLLAAYGTDAADDAFYGPALSLGALAPAPLPDAWRLKASASAGATTVQLEPSIGLAKDLELVDESKLRYRVTSVAGDLASIEPGLGLSARVAARGLSAGALLSRVAAFQPFGENERNRQEHALYVGFDAGLDVSIPAKLTLTGVKLPGGCRWSYWGKDGKDAPKSDWIVLEPTTEGGFTFDKREGAIEPLDIDGTKSRWLRAIQRGKKPEPTPVSGLKLQINCADSPDAEPKPAESAIEMEGVANTAPLVLSQPFYPLGREPRMFDAFYLACEEALSKPNARVNFVFTAGDGFSGPLAAVTLEDYRALALAAGVGNDGRLRLILARDKAGELQFLTSLQPKDANNRPLLLNRNLRPGGLAYGGQLLFSAASGPEILLWDLNDWRSLGAPGGEEAAGDASDTVLAAAKEGVACFAVRGERLFRRLISQSGAWQELLPDGEDRVKIVRIGPVERAQSLPGRIQEADGLVAVTTDGVFWLREEDGGWVKAQGKERRLDFEAYPLAIDFNEAGVLCVGRSAKTDDPDEAGGQEVIAFNASDNDTPLRLSAQHFGMAFCLEWSGGRAPAAVFVAEDEFGARRPLWWRPGELETVARGEVGQYYDAPVRLGDGCFLFPLSKGGAQFCKIDGGGVQAFRDARFLTALVTDAPPPESDDLLFALSPNAHGGADIGSEKARFALPGGRTAIVVNASRPEPAAVTDVALFKRGEPHGEAEVQTDRSRLKLTSILGAAPALSAGDMICARWRRGVEIVEIKTGPSPQGVVELWSKLPGAFTKIEYRLVEPVEDSVVLLRPALALLAPLTLDEAIWPRLEFAVENGPRGLALGVSDKGTEVVLAEPWPAVHAEKVDVTASAAFGEASPPASPPRPRNPELSWEYWNGAGWWRIPHVSDGTADLLTSGSLAFCVPVDLKPTEVVGREKRWIRARLVGGDYGQESFKVSERDAKTVTRDSSGVAAPYIVDLKVGYRVCSPIAPDHVVTLDNGDYRDQTAANSAENAAVAAFTPLADALSGVSGSATKQAEGTPDCGCTPSATSATDETRAATRTTANALKRAIYFGFDKPLDGGPVNLLFLIDEDATAPVASIEVEARSKQGFRPVSADDATRGLTETGLLTLHFAEPLEKASYFGRDAFWLRIMPASTFDGTWSPRIRGVHLNAAWAIAAETQENQRLGSSDGSPNQRLRLPRGPVVDGELEIRVREPLSADDVAALRADDADSVRDAIGGWAGPWALWTQGDPAAASPLERIYAFDASTGEISFGDGKHGRIPPIGRDSIVARRYRVGGGAAANGVRAWSKVSLITPLQGVEEVAVPEVAAGGADAEGDEQVLGAAPSAIAMRDRAVTLRDFERLARQSSPDIAQSRAFATRGGVRIVAAVRAENPVPSRAQLRELKRFLLRRTPPSVTEDTLDVVGPRIAEMTVALEVGLFDLSDGGRIERAASDALRALLDPATGGHDGAGWRFGESPTDTDVAATLATIGGLEELLDVKIKRADGREAQARPNELAQLPPGAVSVRFILIPREVAVP